MSRYRNYYYLKSNLVEPFFEGPDGPNGNQGPRGLRGDRGIRGSAGPAGPAGPSGKGLNESDMLDRTLWCADMNNCSINVKKEKKEIKERKKRQELSKSASRGLNTNRRKVILCFS